MGNRYEQVLLTYLRQWPFWLYVAAWAALMLFTPVIPFFDRPLVFVFIALAGTAPPAVIGHAKQQLADARASLMPGFRAPHVIIAVALSLGAILVMPLLSYRAFDMPSALGLISAVALASAGFSCIAYFQSVTSFILALAVVSLFMIELVREVAWRTVLGVVDYFIDGQAIGAGVIAASVAFLGFIFYRLAVLREDMPEYGRVLGNRDSWSSADARATRMTNSLSLWSRLQLAAGDRRLRVIRNVFAAGMVRRVRHWMLSVEISGMKWLAALAIALLITAMPVITGNDKPEVSAAAIAFICSLVMPLFAVTGTWLPRRRSLGYESTRPVARDRFVREFGLAMAADLFGWWVWLTLAAAVPLLVWAPSARLEVVLPVVVLAAAEQVLAFGILAHVLRLRSADASEGSVMMSLCAVVMPLLIALNVPVKSAGVTLAIALGVAVLGAALTYDAYQRWCAADLA